MCQCVAPNPSYATGSHLKPMKKHIQNFDILNCLFFPSAEDTFNFITGVLDMADGADYGPPLRGGAFQIYDQPLSQSVRTVCYNQNSYDDSDVEGDEYFGLQLVPELRTEPNVVIDPSLSTTVVVILDDDGECERAQSLSSTTFSMQLYAHFCLYLIPTYPFICTIFRRNITILYHYILHFSISLNSCGS